MLIGSMSGVGFAAFSAAVLPAVAAAMLVHTLALLIAYRGRLGDPAARNGREGERRERT